jgi:glutamate-1-semialdehyde 2,1-aminomutase
VRDFGDARKANAERFRRFFHAMLEQGIYLPPSPFEACFVSTAHRPADLSATLAAARVAMRRASRVR